MVYACVGEWDNPASVREDLKEAILYLSEDMPHFLVGNHTALEKEFLSVLREVKREVPDLSYGVVLTSLDEGVLLPGEESFFPEGQAEGEALAVRDAWILEQAALLIAGEPVEVSTRDMLCRAEKRKKQMFYLREFCMA